MTRSDRQRLREALKRYEAKFNETDQAGKGSAEDMLMAAVDWLRAEVKLAARFLEDGDSETLGDVENWLWEHVVSAAVLVASEARQLGNEIREEAKI